MRILARSCTFLVVIALTGLPELHRANAEKNESVAPTVNDSDRDGMDDALEQTLLNQFVPTFMVGRHDCSEIPAEFEPNVEIPTLASEDGTIYGQVFPVAALSGVLPTAEIHFYHLWRRDCGPHGHQLDTEHVAVLVRASDRNVNAATWKALYWYAAAHENTVCDLSQITRASTLHAEEKGATVWISPGKHASYLNEELCHGGCGADKCVDMTALSHGKIINLGEPGHPMNGSVFIASSEWPLLNKMSNSNFPAEPIARLNQMPDTVIAWANTGSHPSQQIIAVSGSTERALAGSARDTTASLSSAGKSTAVALSVAQDGTSNGLGKGFKNTFHGLGVAARDVGAALHICRKPSNRPAKPE